MGHCRELLEDITELLIKDYPESFGFEYIYEKAITHPSARMQPDIIVELNGSVVCVVEIGYTRPEKLTEYQAMGIPDIRWYGKDATLHIHYKMGKSINPKDRDAQECQSVNKVIQTRSTYQHKMLRANDVRAQIMTALDGVIAGTVSTQTAHAVASLSSEYHKSLQQEWNMRVYAAERLTLDHSRVIHLLDSKQ